jgi:RHS repeat-associated protein
MKLKPILTAFAVAFAALAQPALASNYTYDRNGEPTHYKGIPLPPIQTVAEARAATEKKIAAAKAEETKQAAQAATSSNLQSEIGNHQLFYTGKPYLEETGQYLFLFRHYDPELARWTTADPSGFPDGANDQRYAPCPTAQVDFLGLVSVTVTGVPESSASGSTLSINVTHAAAQVGSQIAAYMQVQWGLSGLPSGVDGWVVQRVQWNWSITDNATGVAVQPQGSPTPPTSPFWEAWRYESGQWGRYVGGSFQAISGWNTDNYGIAPQSANTSGFISITGKVDFYRDSVITTDDPRNWGSGAITVAGDLNAIFSQPSWWTGSGFNHNMKLTWVE